ncbi:T9SS type A sorting domain-containing protein [Gramella jeungdoensis]|uniref:T9SS type A sorting domain-containing protein n=1 Tax=Gramella jeungdoensis TaxID=708091 RepID=A0ABT0YW90_9FLAO|nr:two-component regulator propeller domain-containing protein [Gramella jeungdoensis]MCM8567755.1 T9SS type A sorting domain-containing protein [Gramella jeungdoensis]
MKTITRAGKDLFLFLSNLIRLLLPLFFILSLYITYGQSVENYFPEDGLITGGIYTIIQDQNQDLWFGSWTSDEGASGLGKFDGTTWQTISTADGLVGDKVRVVFEDRSSNIWIGTTTGISKWDGTNFTNYTSADGLVGDYVYSIDQDSIGNMWFGTNNGVSKFDGSNWTNYDISTNPSLLNVSVILETNNGDLWFGTTGNGALKFDGSTWTNYDMSNGLGDDQVYAIIQDDKNDLWFGGYDREGGISRFDGSTWTVYDTSDGISNTQVRAIHLDNFGNIWFGHNAGVTRYDGSNWTNFDSEDGLIEGGVRAIISDSNDNLWIGNWLSGVSNLKIGEVNIQDPNFEQALIDLGIDSDGIINGGVLTNDVKNIEVLDVPNRNISSLEGLWAFSNLKFLRAWDNQLTSLDVSSNSNLVHLSVARNQITSLDLTSNTALSELYAYENNLSSLLIPANDQLKHLSVSKNQLTTLNLTGSSALVDIYISENNLSEVSLGSHPDLVNFHAGGNSINALDVTNAPSLRSFLVWGSTLSEIDFTNNPLLEEVDLNVNNLSSLNLSNNPNLNFVFCNSNNLSSLNIANGNNAGMILPEWSEFTLDARGNENLRCIQVDRDMENTTRTDWIANPGIVFSADCTNLPTVYIPDANFEQALIEQGIDSDGIINQRILEVDAAVTTWLELSNSGNGYGISDLTGIEAFVNLNGINCNNNQISNLDFSSNPKLQYIYANESEIQTINVSNNPELVNLHLYNNQISELDLSNNIQLKELIVQTNRITNLDLSANTNLTMAYCADNRLNSLNIANGNNSNFMPPEWSTLAFNADSNPNLFCIQVDEATLGNVPGNWQKDSHAVYNADCSTYIPEVAWGVVGSATPHSWDGPDIPMVYDEQTNTWHISTELNNGEIKFRLNNDWAFNYGDGEWENRILDGILDRNGANIPVTAGQYNISINFDTYEYKVSSSYVNIPDPNFEQALIDLNIDSDGIINQSISRSDAEAFSGTLEVADKGISDLTGIEAFVNIHTLRCNDNLLTSIDLSGNTELINLYCGGINNQLGVLDLSNNTKLVVVSAPLTRVSEINVSNSPELKDLILQLNELTKLDVSSNPKLELLILNQGLINNLDLSNNPLLTDIFIGANPNLSSLDLRNGNNINVTQFYAGNTPNLTCINADADISQAMIDSGKSFNEDCGDFVNIPDPNFEQALIDLGIDSDGVVNTSILRSDAETVRTLNISDPINNQDLPSVYAKIQDLTGIEAFINLSELNASNNDVGIVNLENNSLLINLYLRDCSNLRFLDLSKNTKLVTLDVGRSRLSGTINLDNLSNLEYLYLQANRDITSLNVSNNTKLKVLWCSWNQLTELNVSQNFHLQELWMHNNKIEDIDVSNNTSLKILSVRNNGISKLNLTSNTLLEDLQCNGNNLSSLDLSNQPIHTLYAYDNAFLSSLDLRNGNNMNLNVFEVGNTPQLDCINADGNISQAMLDSGKGFSEDCGDFIYVPDANFEQALIDLGIDSDGVVNTSVLKADVEIVTILNLNNPANNQELPNVNGKIQDLTGIEEFANLSYLYINQNEIHQLDLSGNPNLLYLFAGYNKFSTIDLSVNANLQILLLAGSEIESIDVSKNINLTHLQIGYTNLAEIDLSNNPKLFWINLFNNQLSSIDLSSNTEASQIWISDNKLESIIIPESDKLETLNLNNNLLTSVDLTANPNLNSVGLGNNRLNNLNIQNGNNDLIKNFSATGNIDLTCIQVDPGMVENVPAEWAKDKHTIYSIDCATKPEYVSIPDANFEQSLIDLGIDSDGVINTWLLKSEAKAVTDLNLNNPHFDSSNFANQQLSNVPGQIADLTGIEAFINLKNLQAAYAALTQVDLSANTQLEELFLNDNQLNSVDVSMLPNLKRFGIMRNNMTSGIDVSSNPLLEELFIHNTGITSIDLSANSNLWNLFIASNELMSLDLSANINLKYLFAQYNQLTDLDLSANTALIEVRCQTNQLPQLDITNLTVLERLDAYNNPGFDLITGADGNPSLRSMNLSATGLSNFNGAAYPNLEWLLLNDNVLGNFNGNNNLNLQNLFLNNNAITKLNLTGNAQLKQLQVRNNGMEELDLRNGNNSILGKMNATGNLLTCISVDDPADGTMPHDNWEMDLGVQLSLNCKQAEEVVIIPDPAFEQALKDYDTNGLTGNILLSDAEAVTLLNVNGNEITDATGIEAFVNLTELDMSSNVLTEINLQENVNLVSLNVSGNALNELFISNGKIMTSLNAANNNLSVLNFADLTNLKDLDISGNDFQSLNFSDFGVITSLDVSNNQLESLDLRNGNNNALSKMNATGNLLNCIGVDDAASIPAGWSKDDSTDYTATGDCEAPVVLTQNITVYLDRYGFAEITPADINNGSYDNVTDPKNLIFELDIAQFSCDNLGENDVNLIVTDESGNVGVNNMPAIVTVVDEIAPEVSGLRSITLDLDGGASVDLDPNDINDGSTDNCGNLQFAVDQSSFSFPGEYTVEFIVSDASGNFSSTMVDVEVVDSKSNPTSLKFKGNIVATVYPNPFTEYFKIGFSEPVDINSVEALVFDMQGGQTGLQFIVSGNELISDGNLSQQGIYILQVTLNGQMQSAEIMQN